MPNYQNGKIYTLRCYTDKELVYVGSTTKKLCDRKSNHKTNGYKCPENYFYKTVENNGGWDNWYIELVECFSCNSRSELEKREGEIMRDIGTLNTKMPRGLVRKDNELYQREYLKVAHESPEEIKMKKVEKEQYDREYREINKEKIKERRTAKIECPVCHFLITKDSQARHNKSKIHQDNFNILL